MGFQVQICSIIRYEEDIYHQGSLTVHHFHIDYNAPCSPPKILYNQCLRFFLAWGDCNTQDKLEKMILRNLGGKQIA